MRATAGRDRSMSLGAHSKVSFMDATASGRLPASRWRQSRLASVVTRRCRVPRARPWPRLSGWDAAGCRACGAAGWWWAGAGCSRPPPPVEHGRRLLPVLIRNGGVQCGVRTQPGDPEDVGDELRVERFGEDQDFAGYAVAGELGEQLF